MLERSQRHVWRVLEATAVAVRPRCHVCATGRREASHTAAGNQTNARCAGRWVVCGDSASTMRDWCQTGVSPARYGGVDARPGEDLWAGRRRLARHDWRGSPRGWATSHSVCTTTRRQRTPAAVVILSIPFAAFHAKLVLLHSFLAVACRALQLLRMHASTLPPHRPRGLLPSPAAVRSLAALR